MIFINWFNRILIKYNFSCCKISDNNKYLAFVILIGGKSNRFGTDKGLFKFKGKAFISYQIETLSRFKKDIFLVANSKEQIQRYIDKIDIKELTAFILDEYDPKLEKGLRSPMLGLYSAFKELNNFGYKKIFALSCDNPFITYAFIDYMINQCDKNECCIPKWNNGFLEPLLSIYPVEKAYKTSLKSLEKNQYKLVNILSKSWQIRYVSVEQDIKRIDPNLQSFININKPGDVKKIQFAFNEY
ncbi:MAG: molybdenum cofactor guanylyltransferase [Candidatus Heimdallarchaeota archaeon]